MINSEKVGDNQNEVELNVTLKDLKAKVLSAVFTAPKTFGDPLSRSDEYLQPPPIPPKVARYLLKHVADQLWGNHLVLLAALLAAARLDPSSITKLITILHCRFNDLFTELAITSMEGWKPEEHIPLYLRGEIAKNSSAGMRADFWEAYSTSAKRLNRWLRSLPDVQQQAYVPLVLPTIDYDLVRGLVGAQEVLEDQRKRRKEETDAIVPHFADIRAEAHYRFNMMNRLRIAFKEACEAVISGAVTLPYEFNYDEGTVRDDNGNSQEILYFRLWDRRSFVLNHSSQYGNSTVQEAKKGLRAFSDENNNFLLEYVSVERLQDSAPATGLWFTDMLRVGATSSPSRNSVNPDLRRWMEEWGYIENGHEDSVNTFATTTKGILNWPKDDSQFVRSAMRRFGNIFIPVESLYVAAMFGLLALDTFTTTGARITEVLQASLGDSKLIILTLPAASGAKDQSPLRRYILRLVPKGQRENITEDYYISKETFRLIVRVARMLFEHYGLDEGKGNTLPQLPFNTAISSEHRFGKAAYLFQYNYTHLSDKDITACMRFLLHGIVFRTRENKVVIIKAHLLRHTFATYAVQVLGMPLDIIGAILNQKDLRTTGYYSQATDGLIAEGADNLLARIALHINIAHPVTRSPEDLYEQLEVARKEHGPLSEVPGGSCTNNRPCIHRDACIGCTHKVPEPEKRDQLERRIKFHKAKAKLNEEEGSLIEAEHSKDVIRKAHEEIREIESIERYREDERREVTIRTTNG